MNRALFLDRDGTIIEDPGYLRDPEAIRFFPHAADVLRALVRAGWKLIVVSNQSGVGRGLIHHREMVAVQDRFLAMMKEAGAPITATYVCIHLPEDACQCRKPSDFLVRQAAREHTIDLGASWMIGDRESDIACGKNSGCRTIWLRNPHFSVDPVLPDIIANDWRDIERFLVAAESAQSPIAETRTSEPATISINSAETSSGLRSPSIR